MNPHGAFSFHHRSAARSGSLIAGKHDEVSFVRQKAFQMMEHPSGGEDAARGDDDPGSRHFVQFLRFVDGAVELALLGNRRILPSSVRESSRLKSSIWRE